MAPYGRCPLNNPLTKEEYLRLCKDHASFKPGSVNQAAFGPRDIPFQKSGSPITGYPLVELLHESKVTLLKDGQSREMAVLFHEESPELRLVIWGPDPRTGTWGHHIRRLPLLMNEGKLNIREQLASLVALEYKNFASEVNYHFPVHEQLQVEGVNLVSLQRITGYVYQAKLAYNTRPSSPCCGGSF